jgi:hypothetical protein
MTLEIFVRVSLFIAVIAYTVWFWATAYFLVF